MSYPTASTEPRVENPAPDYCDPKITSAVEEAYEAVWTIIQNNGPSKGAKTECESPEVRLDRSHHQPPVHLSFGLAPPFFRIPSSRR